MPLPCSGKLSQIRQLKTLNCPNPQKLDLLDHECR